MSCGARRHGRLPPRPNGAGALLLGLAALGACADPPPAPLLRAGTAEALPPAALVFAFDPDGDGVDELVTVDSARAPATLRWSGGTQALPGVVQRALRVKLGQDAKETLLIATGAGPGAPDATATLSALGPTGLEPRWSSAGPRAQITELRWHEDQLFIAHFADERAVESGFLDRSAGPGGDLTDRLRVHMGMRQLPLPNGRRAVGTLYGELPKSDGGLLIVERDGQRRSLPSLRGVRALASANLDRDPAPELIVGDGWHAEYGRSAQARLRIFEGPSLSLARTAAVLDGSYAVIDVQAVGEGPGACLLATGSHAVHLLCRDALGWADQRLGPVGETGNAALVRGKNGVQVAISGDPCLLLPLSAEPPAR